MPRRPTAGLLTLNQAMMVRVRPGQPSVVRRSGVPVARHAEAVKVGVRFSGAAPRAHSSRGERRSRTPEIGVQFPVGPPTSWARCRVGSEAGRNPVVAATRGFDSSRAHQDPGRDEPAGKDRLGSSGPGEESVPPAWGAGVAPCKSAVPDPARVVQEQNASVTWMRRRCDSCRELHLAAARRHPPPSDSGSVRPVGNGEAWDRHPPGAPDSTASSHNQQCSGLISRRSRCDSGGSHGRFGHAAGPPRSKRDRRRELSWEFDPPTFLQLDSGGQAVLLWGRHGEVRRTVSHRGANAEPSRACRFESCPLLHPPASSRVAEEQGASLQKRTVRVQVPSRLPRRRRSRADFLFRKQGMRVRVLPPAPEWDSVSGSTPAC